MRTKYRQTARSVLWYLIFVAFCSGCSPRGQQKTEDEYKDSHQEMVIESAQLVSQGDNVGKSTADVAEYTVLEEEKMGFVKIDVSILIEKDIAEVEIESLLKGLCASYKKLYQYVKIWAFASREQYESRMKYLAFAGIEAMGDDPWKIEIDKSQLEYLRSGPTKRFGLSEDKRKEIFREIYKFEDMATLRAMEKYPYLDDDGSNRHEGVVREQNRKRSQFREILYEKYKRELAEGHSLALEQLNEIGAEGSSKKWPIQSLSEIQEFLRSENPVSGGALVKFDGVSAENNQLVAFVSSGDKMSSVSAGDKICGAQVIQIYSPKEPDGITSSQDVSQYEYRIKIRFGQEEKIFKTGDAICIDPDESEQRALTPEHMSVRDSSAAGSSRLKEENRSAHGRTEIAEESIYKELFRDVVVQYETALDFDNKVKFADALERYKALLPKAKTAYSTTDLADKKKLHEVIEVSERREREIGRYMEAVRDIKGRFTSPESLSKWLKKNIHYKSDRIAGDYWQPPDETLKVKTGDCEDFAILVQALLAEVNIPSEVVFIGLKKGIKSRTHAICVFEQGGLYGFFSGPYLHQPFALSIQQLVDQKYPHWTAIAEIKFPAREKIFLARR